VEKWTLSFAPQVYANVQLVSVVLLVDVAVHAELSAQLVLQLAAHEELACGRSLALHFVLVVPSSLRVVDIVAGGEVAAAAVDAGGEVAAAVAVAVDAAVAVAAVVVDAAVADVELSSDNELLVALAWKRYGER